MKPHHYFETIRADEVAETWGVSKELYAALWNKIVPHQKPLREHIDIEESCPNDAIGIENLAAHWSKLNEAEQAELNTLAAAQEAEYQTWRKQFD